MKSNLSWKQSEKEFLKPIHKVRSFITKDNRRQPPHIQAEIHAQIMDCPLWLIEATVINIVCLFNGQK